MESKTLKTQVFVNEVVFNESVEQAIDVDFTLPDYCPDISKIFKCRAVSHISSKGLGGRNITVDGSVCITVMYCSEDGKLCSYEYQYPFSKSLEMSEDCPGGNLKCCTKCEYINCRAVTGRKIDIHGAISINCQVFKRKSNEIISDIDNANIELKRGVAPATTPMGYSEKYLIMEEEIEIGQGQPTVERLLRYDTRATVRESKIINDKVVVKGEMTISALYCPDGSNTPQMLKTTLPFSQIVDMDGITDECECETKAEVAFIDLKPRTTSSGETRSFIMSAKILITCEAYCGNDIAVVLDAFSRKYQANIVKNNICFNRITDNISEIYHCKKSLELSGNITSIADLWCDIQSVSAKAEERNVMINGAVMVGLIAYDQEGIPTYYEKSIDFEYKFSLQKDLRSMRCEPQIEIVSSGYTITSASNIELQVDLSINAAIYECNNLPLIVDMDVDETRLNEKKNDGAMVIYFCSTGECVWDIARRYNASVDEIMQINNLETEEPEVGKMILVPII